jgi:hypothetical protein
MLRRIASPLSCALEILIGFLQTGAAPHGGLGPAVGAASARHAAVRHFAGLSPCVSELLLELQVRETPHRLGVIASPASFRESAGILHGLLEALLDLHVLHVPGHVTQFRQRPLPPSC